MSIDRKKIRINKALTSLDIEQLLSEVTEDQFDIVLPNSIGFGGLGVEALLIQFICTWARNTQFPLLHTYIEESNKVEGFESLCDRMSGMVAMQMADKVFLRDGITTVSKREAFFSSGKKISKVTSNEFISAFKGQRAFFPSLRPSKNNGLIHPLYNGKQVSKSGAFKFIVFAFFEAFYKQPFHFEENSFLINLGNVVHQLFLNTHEHARKDIEGNLFMKEARGVLINKQLFDKKQFTNLFGETDRINKYSNRIFDQHDGQKIHFIEISVVDNGEGFARNWICKKYNKKVEEITVEQEIDAILECFEKHNTTKNNSSSGSGLSTVLESLNSLNGILRVRTGRTLTEWYSESSNAVNKVNRDCIRPRRANIVGTSASILVPILKKSARSV
ncbi:hypothetical protein [Pseudoalteromonas sp. Of11M-6]|uniref:hypothetical protein n=1 Tax=Pseudoalteromonas sp. Of11M-6 TaxID=2917754 RepID=UPI001EF4F38C|nr:hypothetical protein [Pseudoalteromonas sp. Of11M-6]MCG7555919.1 hypothetical protein [Pseudoalteromonas sp. Of11M-6]